MGTLNLNYLMWFDDNPKVSPLHKIEQAIEAYTLRYQRTPNVVLVNDKDNGILQDGMDRMDHQGVEIRGSTIVRKNNYWVGKEQTPKQSPETEYP